MATAGNTTVKQADGDQIMTLRTARHIVLIACIAISCCLWAQDDSAAPSTEKPSEKQIAMAAADQPVSNLTAGKPHDNTFVIGNNDMLAISVWKEPDISRTLPVRSDGRISLPLAGEIQAAGLTPLKLEHDIASKLQNYISEPEVTVIVQQINSQKFNVLGMVARPGSYPLTNSSTILDAIALAGGFRDFAKQKSIYVLRQNPDGTQARMPFNYKQVIKGRNSVENVKLQANDTIVVP
jgi:polysaccharide biosynthesis/export protein